MATESTPLHEFPAEMLDQLAKTLLEMYPKVIISRPEDIEGQFEMGVKVGQHQVAETVEMAARKARKE